MTKSTEKKKENKKINDMAVFKKIYHIRPNYHIYL